MDRDTIFKWYIHFAVSLYLGFWYNNFIPVLLPSEAIDYNYVGILGALVCLAASIVIFSKRNINKYLLVLSVILSTIIYIVSIVYRSFWLLTVISILHGILIGAIVATTLKANQLRKALPFWNLGLFVSLLAYFCNIKYTYFYDENSTSVLFKGDNCFDILYPIVLLLTIIALLMMKPTTESALSSPTKVGNVSQFSIFGYVLTGGLILIETSFVYWSLVLKDDSQGWAFQLTFPLTMFFLFLFRQYFSGIFSKHYIVGWLFASVLSISFSLGLFYTFIFTLIFIVLFSLLMAFAINAAIHIFNQNWGTKSISILLCCIAISMIIGGLYTQNHIEFIQSINMPKDVLHLSAKQAWIKELASHAGAITILTGYIFLRRRSLFHF